MDKRVIRSYAFSERNKKTISGSFRNPSKRKQSNIFLLIIISFFVLIIAILCLLFSRIFNISNVSIEGLKTIDSQKIEKIVSEQEKNKFFVFSQQNLFLFKKDKLIENLSDFNFVSIKINKKIFKRSLIIKIEERQPAIIFLENGVYFIADKEGNIIDYRPSCQAISDINTENNKIESTSTDIIASSTEISTSTDVATTSTTTILNIDIPDNTNNNSDTFLKTLDPNTCITIDDNYKRDNLYPIIENISNDKIDENRKNIDISSEYIDFCLKLYNDIGENVDFGLKSIVLDESYNSVKIRLNNGPEVYFNLKNDYTEQVNSLLILEKELKGDLQGKKYIDLRYGDKIFFN